MTAIIRDWNFVGLVKWNNSELMITSLVNGNEMIFTGLDDVEKLKSIHGITDIWVEEASEISEADFNQLDLRLRGKTKHKKQITLTLNPISVHHWIKKRFFDRAEEDCITHHSTYKDNLQLDDDTRKRLKQITDPYFRDVYVLGKWGVYGNVVFTNYIIEDFDYGENDLENVFTGMDFGTIHASTVERGGFKDGELYCFDELYGKGWTNPDFIQAVEDQWPGQVSHEWIITCDSAEEDRRLEFERNGFRRIEKAKKGPGSLRYGIDFLCSVRIHIHASKCPNLAREIQSFKRREDKDGNAMESFVELNDDCIAALRYGSEYIWSNAGSFLSRNYDLDNISDPDFENVGFSADSLGL
jgi:phage terminase large subunit